jgi:hypothetical protein
MDMDRKLLSVNRELVLPETKLKDGIEFKVFLATAS